MFPREERCTIRERGEDYRFPAPLYRVSFFLHFNSILNVPLRRLPFHGTLETFPIDSFYFSFIPSNLVLLFSMFVIFQITIFSSNYPKLPRVSIQPPQTAVLPKTIFLPVRLHGALLFTKARENSTPSARNIPRAFFRGRINPVRRCFPKTSSCLLTKEGPALCSECFWEPVSKILPFDVRRVRLNMFTLFIRAAENVCRHLETRGYRCVPIGRETYNSDRAIC